MTATDLINFGVPILVESTSTTTMGGPVSEKLDTNLTKCGAVPSKHISKEEFNRIVAQMREEGIGAEIPDPRAEEDELESAKLHLSRLERAYKADRGGLNSFISRDEVLGRARANVSEIQKRYDREAALKDARETLRQKVRDAIAKRRSARG